MATDAHTESNGAVPDVPVHIEGSDHLAEVVDSHGVVVVDFYADWCGPCKMLEPVLKTVAAETDAVIAKVDVDANQPLAGEYGVRGVPTLVFFADGEQVDQQVGVLPEDRLRALIDEYASK